MIMSINTKEIALFGLLGGLTFSAKVAMMGLPNIEPVTLMVMLFSVTFKKKAIYPIYIYVLLEFVLYGLNLWSINYLYVWAILAIAAYLMKGMNNRFGWALLAAAFGLLFGVFCAPVYAVVGGFSFARAWWINGIPFDLIHGISNFCIVFVLFNPLRYWLNKLYCEMD